MRFQFCYLAAYQTVAAAALSDLLDCQTLAECNPADPSSIAAAIRAGEYKPPFDTSDMPVIFGDIIAWEGDGLWVLDMNQASDETIKAYNALPLTFDVSKGRSKTIVLRD